MLYNIEELIWDDWNVDHIKKHNVSVLEVQESCEKVIEGFESYKNRLIILGKTKSDRLLTIVLIEQNKKSYYVVTARDMSRKERRLINEK